MHGVQYSFFLGSGTMLFDICLTENPTAKLIFPHMVINTSVALVTLCIGRLRHELVAVVYDRV